METFIGSYQEMNDGRTFLESLLAPFEVDQFFKDYWEQKPLYLPHEAPRFDSLLKREDVNNILASNDLRHPFVRLVREGKEVPRSEYMTDVAQGDHVVSDVVQPDRVDHFFNEGATVILQALHTRWKPLGEFCQSLQSLFGPRIQTNVFLTPGDTQGSAPHFDTHDVFVLQLSGRKHWKIFESPIRLPETRQQIDPAVRANIDMGSLTAEYTLSEGDLLYIPRGWAHDARSEEEDSLHITVGVMPNNFVDLFLGVATTAVKDAAFRRSLPVGSALSYEEAYRLADQFKGMMKAHIDGFDPMELVSHLRQ